MGCEFYTLEWNGKRLRMEADEDAQQTYGDDFSPAAPWAVHSCLGDDSKIWCEVYRAPGKKGALFVLRDFDELLLVGEAGNNLDFIQALDFFARVTSNSRYAADIFEHADDDAEE